MSGAVVLLWYFRTPEETLEYYKTAPGSCWSGNILFGTLSAMLAICTIQDLYTHITGKTYSLPSLPKKSDLEHLREKHRHLLRPDQNIEWFDEVGKRLIREL